MRSAQPANSYRWIPLSLHAVLTLISISGDNSGHVFLGSASTI